MNNIRAAAAAGLGSLCLAGLALAAGNATPVARSVPAFPGAQGFGMHTPGGRGGKVLLVTNLEDYAPGEEPIPGSLRAACYAKGPRIVVFRVSGTIPLKATLRITQPFLTLAGQTAPGDGICIKSYATVISTHDVIVRHVRFRPGDEAGRRPEYKKKGFSPDGLAVFKGRNVVIDHCSVSWGVDEVLAVTEADYVTVQWCIVAEGLDRSTHTKGRHSKGLMVAYRVPHCTLHHNLILHCNDRNPYLQTEFETPYVMDVVNNVVYNWGGNAGIGYAKTNHNGDINFIGNYYIKGTNSRRRPCLMMGVDARVYARGNIGPTRPTLDGDEYLAIQWTGPRKRPGLKAQQRFDAPQVATHSHLEAYRLVLAGAGATGPKRDAVDRRLIREVKTRKGRIIDHPSDVGGWPELESAPPPADADNDGMPDQWETKHRLNPNDPSDGPRDEDRDGYTNIEEWLNATDPRKSDAGP